MLANGCCTSHCRMNAYYYCIYFFFVAIDNLLNIISYTKINYIFLIYNIIKIVIYYLQLELCLS